jgi:hypothetical protein
LCRANALSFADAIEFSSEGCRENSAAFFGIEHADVQICAQLRMDWPEKPEKREH